MHLNGVVWGPTLWKGSIDALKERQSREEMAAKQTVFVVHHKGGSVMILFLVECLHFISDTNNHSKDMLHHYHNTMGGNRSIFPSRCRHDHLND